MDCIKRAKLVFKGEVIKGSNIMDLVNHVMQNWKTFDHPYGWHQCAHALHQSNMPRKLVGNLCLWDCMHHESATLDAYCTEEEITPFRREKYRTQLMSRTQTIQQRLLEPLSVKKELKWEPATLIAQLPLYRPIASWGSKKKGFLHHIMMSEESRVMEV